MKTIDCLWLFEHVARELDAACAVRAVARLRHEIDIVVRNIYRLDYLDKLDPAVVVHPFFYRDTDEPSRTICRRWPDAIHVNAQWEQLHYPALHKIKAVQGDIATKVIRHLCWGQSRAFSLFCEGVCAENVKITGNLALGLYSRSYRSKFITREELAARYGLDISKKWIFVPENYHWAFRKDLDYLEQRGGDRKEMKCLVQYCTDCFRDLLAACVELSRNDGLEVILRPRPAIHSEQIREFIDRTIVDPGRMRMLKSETVRQWIMASDVVVSSYSTSLIEAAWAGKQIMMFTPRPMPDSLHCQWYRYCPEVYSASQLMSFVLENDSPNGSRLLLWAQSNLMDVPCEPIGFLADHLGYLCNVEAPRTRRIGDVSKPSLRNRARTHEMDGMSNGAIETFAADWLSFINNQL